MNLKNIILDEMIQAQEDKLFPDLTYMWKLKNLNL